MRSAGARVPSLDGLRAISVLCVLFGHVAGPTVVDVSNLGVRAFFVISGFLITKLLLDELARTGGIDVLRFYFRRTLRIFPPYGVFLAGLVVLHVAGVIVLPTDDLVRAATYVSNYDLARSWNVAHTWSLAVEEQFYLLWPAVLVLAGPRAALIGAALFVLLGPLIRVASWELLPGARDGIGHRFETVGDAIAAGCLLAGVEARLLRSPRYRAILGSRWLVLLPVAVVALSVLRDRPRAADVAVTLVNVAIALGLHRVVVHPGDAIGRLLNARPVVFVGAMSYSLYLWQQVFLNRASDALFTTFPVNVALTVALALASYSLVERPALRWRQRWEARLWAPAADPIGEARMVV